MRPQTPLRIDVRWLWLAASLLVLPSTAGALSFDCATHNTPECVALGGQLSVEVVDPGGGEVSFVVSNLGPIASSITGVYFDFGPDGGVLAGISSLLNQAGVAFSPGGSPPDLPGGNGLAPPFDVSPGLLATSDAPTSPNGIHPGGQLGISFDLEPGADVADVLAALGSEALRIGLKVQSIGVTDESDSFVSRPVAHMPEPGASTLFGVGALLFGAFQRRRPVR